MNERQALIGEYALYFDRILGQFPGYLELARWHATALGSCQNILDLGCGPGIVSEELLKSGKQRHGHRPKRRHAQCSQRAMQEFPLLFVRQGEHRNLAQARSTLFFREGGNQDELRRSGLAQHVLLVERPAGLSAAAGG